MQNTNPSEWGGSGDPPILSVTLTPHRSLGPRGFVVLMVLFGLTCFFAGLRFYALGAWPIVIFLALDVALVWAAFKLNYRAGRAFEVVDMSRTALTIRKVSPGGRETVFTFNPAWVRLEVVRSMDEGVTRVAVHAEGRTVPIGAFLNPVDRTDFARALDAALATARA